VIYDGPSTVNTHSDDSRFKSRTLMAGLERTDGPPKLWLAVLAQAFRDFDGDIVSEGPISYRDSQVKYCRRVARAWFLSDSHLVGGFQWTAELFELDVHAVRKRLFSGKRISLDESFEDSSPKPLGESPSECS
jgi:hypothetical protein